MIKDDFIEGLSLLEVENKEMNFFEFDEAVECIKVLYEIDIKWCLYYFAVLIGGFCRGEVFVCEWYLDVDWDKGGIYVNRLIFKIINGEFYVKSLKLKSF